MHTIEKGSYIKAEWLDADPFNTASLTGMQLKTTATTRAIEGTVRHIRSSTPYFAPGSVVVFVETDDNQGEPCARCGCNEVQIKPAWITEVIELVTIPCSRCQQLIQVGKKLAEEFGDCLVCDNCEASKECETCGKAECDGECCNCERCIERRSKTNDK
jgi:hypothetical protein